MNHTAFAIHVNSFWDFVRWILLVIQYWWWTQTKSVWYKYSTSVCYFFVVGTQEMGRRPWVWGQGQVHSKMSRTQDLWNHFLPCQSKTAIYSCADNSIEFTIIQYKYSHKCWGPKKQHLYMYINDSTIFTPIQYKYTQKCCRLRLIVLFMKK